MRMKKEISAPAGWQLGMDDVWIDHLMSKQLDLLHSLSPLSSSPSSKIPLRIRPPHSQQFEPFSPLFLIEYLDLYLYRCWIFQFEQGIQFLGGGLLAKELVSMGGSYLVFSWQKINPKCSRIECSKDRFIWNKTKISNQLFSSPRGKEFWIWLFANFNSIFGFLGLEKKRQKCIFPLLPIKPSRNRKAKLHREGERERGKAETSSSDRVGTYFCDTLQWLHDGKQLGIISANGDCHYFRPRKQTRA